MQTPISRDDFTKQLFLYLDPLRPHYSELGARVTIGHTSAQYEDEVIPMEAWARPLWGLAPFWAGGGHDAFFEDVYRRGLVAGTDPASPEYWGDCRDHDQKFVEMGAIAYALMLAPGVLWEPLADEERARVAAWLAKINEHECPPGNWLLFCVLVNVALRRLGQPYDERMLADSLRRADGFYLGDGWCQDGPTGVLDYYVPFAFDFYGLVLAEVEDAWTRAGESEPLLGEAGWAARFRERAGLLAPQLATLFSDRGEGVPYGRSMTYRFAQVAFFSAVAAFGAGEGQAESGAPAACACDVGAGAAGAVCARSVGASEVASDTEVIPPELLDVRLGPAEVKGLVARSLAWWSEQPVFDNGGILSIGYRYPNLHMAEGYNAPGSPLWALKAFACLALPAGDPFWALPAAPLPELPEVAAIARGHQLVQREGGEAALYPDGSEPGHPFAQASAKYSKLCYTTRFGFSAARGSRTLEDAAPDSCLAFVIGGQPAQGDRPARAGHVFVREGVEKACLVRTEAGSLAMDSLWSPWPGIEVETVVEPIAGAAAGSHVRRHRVTSSIPCEAYDCGFAVPGDYHTVGLAEAEHTCRVRALGGSGGQGADLAADLSAAPAPGAVSGEPAPRAASAPGAISGQSAPRAASAPSAISGQPTLIKAEANTNVSCGKTVIPAVRYQISVGTVELITEVLVLS